MRGLWESSAGIRGSPGFPARLNAGVEEVLRRKLRVRQRAQGQTNGKKEELGRSSDRQGNRRCFSPGAPGVGLLRLLAASGLRNRRCDDGLDLVFVDSKAGSLPVSVAGKWLGNYFFGGDLPLALNNVADVLVGTAVDGLSGCHVGPPAYLWR